MSTFALSSLNSAWGPGLQNYENLQALARQKAREQGQTEFIKYLLSGQGSEQPQDPTLPTPSPSQGSPSKAPAAPAGGSAPGTETTTQDSTSTKGFGFIPDSIRGYVQAIIKQDPKASTDEVMAALESATPYFNAQQKTDLARMKLQGDMAYKGAKLAIDKEKADAYRHHMFSLSPQQQLAEGQKILSNGKAIKDNLDYYTQQQAQGVQQVPYKGKQVPISKVIGILKDAQVRNQQYFSLWQSSRAGPQGQQFESMNPPPDEPDDDQGASGGDQPDAN